MKHEVTVTSGHRGVRARRAIAPGETVLPLVGITASSPARSTLQIGPDAHLHPLSVDADDERSAWCFVNHSCNPNCAVSLRDMALVALRCIQPGEELTFDYCSTEYDMAEPFACGCGDAGCYGEVRGFRHLPRGRQLELLPRLAPHLVALGGGAW